MIIYVSSNFILQIIYMMPYLPDIKPYSHHRNFLALDKETKENTQVLPEMKEKDKVFFRKKTDIRF
jgi:hypothetical protein